MDALAEEELDDAEDLVEEVGVRPGLSPEVRETGRVELAIGPVLVLVSVRGWPVGLALAAAAAPAPPSVGVSLTTTGFQKMVSTLALLHLPSSSCRAAAAEEYHVEANQWQDGVASVRAQPRVSGDALAAPAS